MALTYFPFGVLLVLKFLNGKTDNVDPRKATEHLKATSPLASKCLNAHNHMLEGFPFIAAAVIAALQAGVAATVVSQFSTLVVVLRTIYVLAYILQTSDVLASLRTLTFIGVLMLQSKLFFLAAAQKL